MQAYDSKFKSQFPTPRFLQKTDIGGVLGCGPPSCLVPSRCLKLPPPRTRPGLRAEPRPGLGAHVPNLILRQLELGHRGVQSQGIGQCLSGAGTFHEDARRPGDGHGCALFCLSTCRARFTRQQPTRAICVVTSWPIKASANKGHPQELRSQLGQFSPALRPLGRRFSTPAWRTLTSLQGL